MRSGSRRRLVITGLVAAILALVATVGIATRVQAAARVWTGAGGEGGLWSDTGNWAGGVVPVSGDTLTFPAGASSLLTSDDIAGLTIAAISFDEAYQMNGLDLAISGPISISATAGQVIVSNNLSLAAPVVDITNANPAVTDLFMGNLSETGGARAARILGPGRIDLQGNATYTGGTTVDGATAGYLLMDGTSTTNVTVEPTATLGGNGTAGNVTIGGGTLAPGASPGHLTVATLSLSAGSTYAVELDGVTAGSQYDQVTSGGAVSLGGSTLSISLGFSPAPGTSFTIIDKVAAGPVSGGFAGLPEGTEFLSSGQHFRITYTGGDGNDVVLLALNAFTSTTTVSSSKNPSAFGDSVTFSAHVAGTTGTPTGTVTFLDGGATLATVALNASGDAGFTIASLAVGTHSITARYNGDPNFNGSAASVSQVVTGIPVPATGVPLSPLGLAFLLVGTALVVLANRPRNRRGAG